MVQAVPNALEWTRATHRMLPILPLRSVLNWRAEIELALLSWRMQRSAERYLPRLSCSPRAWPRQRNK